MKMNPLGRTGIEVSDLCLGSMTWGTQTSADEAHDQINYALEHGINFIDTAEMYPVNPVSAETIGRTERIIGLWLDDHSRRRHDVVLATKHSGAGMKHVRGGAPITAKSIPTAIDGSLRRLKTDFIDLYQFHWPNRGSYMFRQNWKYDPSGQQPASEVQNMEDCMGALQDEVKKGRIRAFGLSNESAWGTMQWIAAAERTGGPRPASIQNEYSMACRMFDTDLAEVSLHEDVGLLAFSPLAAGLLTGKYQKGVAPEGSRASIVPDLGKRRTDRMLDAVDSYMQIARRYGLDPVHMALAWCTERPFMTSVIFGATTMDQLQHIMDTAKVQLTDEVRTEINAANQSIPMPF